MSFLSLRSIIPPGTIFPFMGWAVPDGWLLCDGSLISRTTYKELFQVLSYSFGAYVPGGPTTTAIYTSVNLNTEILRSDSYITVTDSYNGSSLYYGKITSAYPPTYPPYPPYYYPGAVYLASSMPVGTGNFTVTSGIHDGNLSGPALGDGSTTFRVPDMRGIFVKGAGSHRIVTSGTLYSGNLGQKQVDQIEAHGHEASSSTITGQFGWRDNLGGLGVFDYFTGVFSGSTLLGAPGRETTAPGTQVNHKVNISATPTITVGNVTDGNWGGDTRPSNISVNYIIKT